MSTTIPIDEVPAISGTLDAFVEVWTEAARAAGLAGRCGSPRDARQVAEATSDAELIAMLGAAGRLRRQLDAAIGAVATELADRADRDTTADSLARRLGHRNRAELVANEVGVTTAEAKRFEQVGCAVNDRRSLLGERLPAEAEHLAPVVDDGTLGLAAAEEILAFRRRLRCRVSEDVVSDGERMLVELAPGLSLRELRKAIAHLEAHLDADGLEPRVEHQVAHRSLRFRTDAAGMVHLSGRFDPVTAAPIRAAIDHLITQHLRGAREEVPASTSGPVFRLSTPGPDARLSDAANPARGPGDGDLPGPVSVEERTVPQLAADALATLCTHVLGCDSDQLPRTSTTVVVRMTLDDLNGSSAPSSPAGGSCEIDGGEPIDGTSARRIAAKADLIPMVLGTEGEVLDVGRRARSFTTAQRLALVERDGGCAFCGLPPSMTEAHHIRWWARHGGATNLDNGVLLCTTCHHRIHEGWDVNVVPGSGGGTVWFRPPALIDRHRTPRIGGRKRFDPAFADRYPPSPLPEPAWSAHAPPRMAA